MTSLFSGPQAVYLVIAVIVLALSVAGIVWVGRTIRGELGAADARDGDPLGSGVLEQVPPTMMKEAIARGLVVPSQLAAMTAAERMFLFASVRQKLAPPESAPPSASPAQERRALPADLPPAMAALLSEEKLRVWCPMCGTELQLPAFPPMLARCARCGMKTAIRAEDGGRYVLNVAPPPTPGNNR